MVPMNEASTHHHHELNLGKFVYKMESLWDWQIEGKEICRR